jgi:hypothetical protein
LQSWLAQLKERLAEQVRVGEYLLREEPADVFMMGISAGHCAGHQFWHAHDPQHPLHGRFGLAGRDPLEKVYRDIDRAVGTMIAAAGQPENVMVIAAPGMGSSYLRWDLLDDILVRLDRGSGTAEKRLTKILKAVWRRVPGPLKYSLAPLAHLTERQLNEHERTSRRFYAARSNDSVGGIIVNVR